MNDYQLENLKIKERHPEYEQGDYRAWGLLDKYLCTCCGKRLTLPKFKFSGGNILTCRCRKCQKRTVYLKVE
jgi:hypothetical protein